MFTSVNHLNYAVYDVDFLLSVTSKSVLLQPNYRWLWCVVVLRSFTRCGSWRASASLCVCQPELDFLRIVCFTRAFPVKLIKANSVSWKQKFVLLLTSLKRAPHWRESSFGEPWVMFLHNVCEKASCTFVAMIWSALWSPLCVRFNAMEAIATCIACDRRTKRDRWYDVKNNNWESVTLLSSTQSRSK